MQNDYRMEDSGQQARAKTAAVRRIHFCVVVNQWCRGTAESGRPDDCLGCGKCEQREE